MGHSLSDQYAIRKIIGECKQDDILWPNLSAREHLELFAGIRGVSRDKVAETVQEWLESVDLDAEEVQHARASSYSGGMKRRLSVALSTIGQSKIIVLDEPTTGEISYILLLKKLPSYSYAHVLICLMMVLFVLISQEWTPYHVVMFGNTFLL